MGTLRRKHRSSWMTKAKSTGFAIVIIILREKIRKNWKTRKGWQ